MKAVFGTLLRVFVKPFFRENFGALIFFYTVTILAVGHLDGEGVLHYHYMLIVGMLRNADTFVLVFLVWLLYQWKCLAFVVRAVGNKQNQFLYFCNRLPRSSRFGLMLLVMIILFGAIGWYGWLIIGVALYHHYYFSAILIFLYMALVCCLPAARAVAKMNYPGLQSYRASSMSGLINNYPATLIRFIFEEQKVIWISIKTFTCALIYGFTRVNTAGAYDPRFPFLFFTLGILANGVIVHRIRSFEENYMVSYRVSAVSLFHRWMQYLIVYAVVLIPEFITIGSLAPAHLYPADAVRFALCAFALVILLNSICFLEDFTMVQYLRVILAVMCVQYFFVLSDAFSWLFAAYFVLAAVMFFTNFHSFEKRPKSGNF